MQAVRHWSVRHATIMSRVYAACSRLAPILSRPVRWLGEARSAWLLTPVERATKRFFFDCQMCGQCALSSTGMACPTNCAKLMRNGPCGGVREDGNCEVKPGMRCVWVEATEGRRAIAGGLPRTATALLPVDQRLKDSSTWIRMIKGEQQFGMVQAAEPAPVAREAHDFERACQSGRFLVTVEVEPPDSPDPALLLQRAARFAGLVDAINITDGAGGNCHMSSAAAAAILAANGLTPVCQTACRDRNRIAVQGDILGAAALGVRNFLCLTGDDVSQGDHPGAKPVFDLDSVSLLRIARGMRDGGHFASGRKLQAAPNLFLGASANPFVPPYADRVLNLQQKIEAGAQFIQTQFCFDVAMLEDFMREVRARELHRRARIIVGVGTLRSAKALARMAARVPGVHVPQAVLERIGAAEDQQAEAKSVLIETIRAVRDIEGIGGVHLMGHRNETMLAEAIVASGARN
jgi:methylenetetrahydrofolate reductase (NADPH)